MMDKTEQLAADLRADTSISRQLDLMAGAYSGASCVVLTCGPSLADHEPTRLRPLLEGRLVIAVKQAVEVAGPAADFLCFNAYNASRYTVDTDSTIRIFNRDPSGNMKHLNDFDIELHQRPHSADLADSLACTHEYEQSLLAVDPTRPWGPGILHEVVFPLVVHLGVSDVTTIGWDIANAKGNNVHYYDRQDDFFDRGRADAHKLTGIRGRLPQPVKRALRGVRSSVQHRRGRVYNRTTMLPGEAELVAGSLPSLNEWLAGHGVELSVVSDSPLFSADVRRLSPEDFYATG